MLELDHLIVPSHEPDAAAKLLAGILDVSWEPNHGPFTAVYVNPGLTFDFGQRDQFQPNHYCFRVTDREIDEILERVRSAGFKHRSHPMGPDDLSINTQLGGRNFYWTDRDGHVWEVLTVSYARQGVA
jgi:catechol 2,3-dioxygenase-like lactoylglutathione lyase family enzyme